MIASEFISKLIVGQNLKYREKLGYPSWPGSWKWTFGSYIAPWSIDDIVLKVDNEPVVIRWTDVEVVDE